MFCIGAIAYVIKNGGDRQGERVFQTVCAVTPLRRLSPKTFASLGLLIIKMNYISVRRQPSGQLTKQMPSGNK